MIDDDDAARPEGDDSPEALRRDHHDPPGKGTTESVFPPTGAVHPACNILPRMTPQELSDLTEDVRANGLREPVVTWHGQLVDGRHRVDACRRADVEVVFRALDTDMTEEDVVRWVVSVNLKRRHLTPSQRAMTGAELAEELGRLARERRLEGNRLGGMRSPGEGKSSAHGRSTSEDGGKSAAEAAKAVGVSPRAVERAQVVRRQGVPALQDEVKAGAASVRAAADVARLPPEEQERVVAAGATADTAATLRQAREVLKALPAEQRQAAVREIVDDKTLRQADGQRREDRKARIAEKAAERARDQAKRAHDAVAGLPAVDLRLGPVEALLHDPALLGRASLVHIDPPWTYDNAASNGAAAGQYPLVEMPDICDVIDRSFDLALPDAVMILWCTFPKMVEWARAQQTLRWRHVTGGAWAKRVNQGDRQGIGHWVRGDAEPYLIFTKGRPQRLRNDVSNLISERRSAVHSEKPVGGLPTLVEALCAEGGLVVDLYAGFAPVARACAATRRRYVGAELDEARHAQALTALVECTRERAA